MQRRINGGVDFYRNWADYKKGFGDLSGEFWLGNDILHLLTNTPRTLRVEVEAMNGEKGYAEYSTLQVANEDQKYRLTLQDAMTYNRGSPFSTKDRDNDIQRNSNCAVSYYGAWWFKKCTRTHLNGRIQHITGIIPWNNGIGFLINGIGFCFNEIIFRINGIGFQITGIGFRINGIEFRITGVGFRIIGIGFRITGVGFRITGVGFRINEIGN
ncbi:Ficolin-1 [Mizuhopecten yessoensis]|uniref:Ficolin-1 n=1 Tax=Mizuhopecten yessoensis TaxID=6573 RepID=A0A210QLP3_MIZYE|nr:Ficolin-1 [Mizuhopecten yessoensis]